MTVTDHPAEPAQEGPWPQSRWADVAVAGQRPLPSESPFGPSPALRARSLPGWEKFLRSAAGDQEAAGWNPAEAEGEEEAHPLLHRLVRDVASRREGELTSVVRERHGGRVIRVAHIQPVNGIAWSTALGNVVPA